MDTKLTLKLNSSVIASAKAYAKENNTSLSRLIERYLETLTQAEEPKDGVTITLLVESLTGVISETDIPEDIHQTKAQYLSQKHS